MKYALLLLALTAIPGHCMDSVYLDASILGVREYEKPWLNKYPQASRDGNTLSVTIGTQTIVFADNITNGEDSRWHSLVRVYPRSTTRSDFLVMTGYSEGYDYSLINGETGAQVKVTGEPLPSSNRLYYLYSSCDLDAGYKTNELVIILAADFSKAFEQRFNYSTYACPLSAKWTSDEEIVVLKKSIVRKTVPGRQYPVVSSVIDSYALRKRDGKWTQEALGVSN